MADSFLAVARLEEGAAAITARFADGSWVLGPPRYDVLKGAALATPAGGTTAPVYYVDVEGSRPAVCRTTWNVHKGTTTDPWGPVEAVSVDGTPWEIDDLTAATTGSDEFVLLLSGTHVYYAVSSNGTWQAEWQPVGSASGFTDVACAAVGTTVYAVAAGAGTVWLNSTDSGGNWQSWSDLGSQMGNAPGKFTAATCAGGDTLQVVGVVGGNLWHTIQAGDSWQKNWGEVNLKGAPQGGFTAVGGAGVDGTLQLLAVDTGGTVWHTVRAADGSWQPTWGRPTIVSPVSGVEGAVYTGSVGTE